MGMLAGQVRRVLAGVDAVLGAVRETGLHVRVDPVDHGRGPRGLDFQHREDAFELRHGLGVGRAVGEARLLRLKRPCWSSSRPSTVPTPSSIGNGGDRLGPDFAEVIRLRLRASCRRMSAAQASAPSATWNPWSSANSLALRRWSMYAAERDVDREHRRQRDDQHGHDQRDAALACRQGTLRVHQPATSITRPICPSPRGRA